MKTPEQGNSAYENWRAIPETTVQEWLTPENLATKNKRTFRGFEIIDSVDGRVDKEVEVSFVKITEQGQYPQHFHKDSDAYFIIIEGEAFLLSGDQRRKIEKGERIEIPRGMLHGFELAEGETLEFISIQSPPIKNEHTGEEDFHLFNQI